MSGEDSRGRQRTAEEREAARRERAERRRLREGGRQRGAARQETSPPSEHRPAREETPLPSEHRPAREETPLPLSEHRPAPEETSLPLSEHRPAPEETSPPSEPRPAPAATAAPEKAVSEPTPSETRWTPRPAELAGKDRARIVSAQNGRARSDSGSGRRRRSIRARIAALLGLVLLAAVLWLLVSIFQPFTGSGHGRVTVTIPNGASAGKVGEILAHDGVIESSFFFDVRTFIDGSRGDLHAGTFKLKRGMSYSAAIEVLSKASAARPKVVKVVIPEGETRVQIAQTARRDGLRGNYLKASRRAPNFPPSHYGAPASTPNLEGFLFPATYELDVGASVNDLVDEQLVAFSERFGPETARRAKALKLTSYQLLIVASMIEREAELPHDRPLVAAVIYNRLRLGMPLGIDATIRFALNDYDRPLTESQLSTPSPYNTRLHKGLPPTPISNPGIEAIEAAAHPAKAAYLYYVAGADGCGDLVFANGYEEFERESNEYHEAIEANGGRVPACKHG